MRLSFVIPAYNEEAYVGDCIRSILMATRASFAETEIIVVNDASMNAMREIAQGLSARDPGGRTREGATWLWEV